MKTATLKYMKTLVIAAIAGFVITSCGKKGDDGNQNLTTVCPFGTYQTEVGCFDAQNNPMLGYNNLEMGFLAANFNLGTVGPTLRISNGGAYQAFLKEAMGVCNRSQSNYGVANCSQWLAGYLQVMLQAPNNFAGSNVNAAANVTNASVTFWAYPRTANNSWYAGQMPKIGDLIKNLFGQGVISNVGAYRNPLPLGLTVSLINNSQGFEGRGYGAYDSTANTGLVQMQVMNGKITDLLMNFRLFYKGQEFATGSFKRCRQSECGITQY